VSGNFPTVSWEDLARPAAPVGGDLSRYLPTMPAPARPGWLGAGIASGYQNLVGSGGSAIEAIGRATGLGGVERYGRSVADYRDQRAQEVGRPDLATVPWREGGASVLPWLGYNVAQQVPNLALTIGAFLVGGPGGAAAAAARGGGLRAGLNATAAAVGTSPGAVLAGASMLPYAAGSMYSEAVESARATTGDQAARPGVGEALAALGLSPLYAAAEALPTARLMGIGRGAGVGATGANRATRGVRGAIEAGVTEFGTEGVQTALEQAFRPDLTLGQRANNVLDGALTGLAVGGVLGGGAGLASRNATRAMRDKAPGEATNEDLTASIDQALSPMTGADAMRAAQPDLFGAPTQLTPAEGGPRDPTYGVPQPTPEQQAAAEAAGAPLPDLLPRDNPALTDAATGEPVSLGAPNAIRRALLDGGVTKDSQATRSIMRMFENVRDEAELAAQVRTELYNESLPARVRDRIDMMANALGLDSEGKPRDLAPEMAAARAEAQAALAAKDAKAARAAAAKIERLQRAERAQQGLAELDQRNSRQPLTAEQSAAAEQPYPGLFPLGLPIRGSLANPAPVQERVSAGAPQDGTPIPLPPPGSSPELPLGAAAPFQQSLGLDLPVAQTARMTPDVATLSQRALAPPGEIAVLPEQRGVVPQSAPAAPQPSLPGLPLVGGRTTQLGTAPLRESAGAPLEGSPIPVPPAGTGPTLDLQPPAPRPTTLRADPLPAVAGQARLPLPAVEDNPALNLGSNMPWRDRVVAMMTLEGASDATQERARRWLIEYDAQGMRPGMQQRAQSIVMAGAREVGVRRQTPRQAAPVRQTTPPTPTATVSAAAPTTAAVAPAKETPRGQVQADAVRKGREGQVARPASQPATPPSSIQRNTQTPKSEASPAAPTAPTKQEAKRREIAVREAVQPRLSPTTRIDSPTQAKTRALLRKIASDKSLPVSERTEAGNLAEAPVGRLDMKAAYEAVRGYNRVVKERETDAALVRQNQEAVRKAREAAAAAEAKAKADRFENNELRPLIESIVADKDTPQPLRTRAERALAAMREDRLNAKEQADAVARDYEAAQARRQAGKIAPDWAREHATDVGGRVVFWRDDVALVRGSSVLTGQPVYVGVLRENGQRTRVDIKSYTGDLFTAAQKNTLTEARDRIEAEDAAAYQKAPDGPFSGAAGQVTATAGVSAALRNYTQGLLQQVNMGDLRVFLVMSDDIAGAAGQTKYALNGPYASALSVAADSNSDGTVRQFGPGMRDFYISIKPDISERRQIETIAHEVGHIIEKVALRNATPETRQEILAEHKAWVEKQKGQSARRLIVSLRNQETGTAQSQSVPANMEAKDLGPYWTSFGEWFADQVSKWATTSEQPRTLAERFFKSVGDALQKMARFFVGDRAPTAAVKTFIENIPPGDARMWRESMTSRGSTEAQKMAGVSKGVADADRLVSRATTAALKALDTAVDAARNGKNVSTAMRAQVLYATTLNHIARVFGRMFPVPADFQQRVDGARNLLENVSNINRRRAAISAKFAELFRPTWAAYERLEQKSPELAKKMRWLMEIAAYEIDPRKKWDDQPWLHKKNDQEKYQRLVREANQTYAEMREGRAVFDDMATFNQMQRYASMTTLLSNIIVSDPEMRRSSSRFAEDPMTEFLNESALSQQNVTAARDWWKANFERRLGAAEQIWRDSYAAALNAANRDPKTQAKVDPKLRPTSRKDAPPSVNNLGRTLFDLRKNATGLQQHPYFHLGRTGDYFASFNLKADPLRKGERGQAMPDIAAAERLTQALEAAGFDDFSIPTEAERNNVFLRVETPTKRANLERVLQKLQEEGVLSDLKSGHRDQADFSMAADAKFLENAVSRFSASAAFNPPEGASPAEIAQANKDREKAINQLKEVWFNMLPSTSESRVMTARKVVPGWSKNMMTSYAFRANVGNLALANLSTSAQMNATLTEMRKQLDESQTVGSDVDPEDKIRRQQVLQELLTRETNRPMHAGRDMVDSFRAVNYAFFLGMSPAYMLNNLTQVGVTLWPELAKKHGFMKSARAVASATGLAIRVVSIAAKQGFATSAREALEPGITQKAMDDAGVPKGMQEYLVRLINTGVVDIGAAARELGRLAETNSNGKLDTVLRYAGAFGLYSEAAVRLASAIALHTLNAGKIKDADLIPEAVRIIDDTMFNYTEANVGRALGRSGVAGRFTPIATAFQQFNAQMLEKLYREFDAAMTRDPTRNPGESDKDFKARQDAAALQRKEGRKFLAGHAAAITVLAGSLGLPFVTAIAAAVNNLKDLFDDDDEPFDMVASWRNFLSATLGKDLGEVAARGLPRAFGFDMSARVGEQNILPLSRFLADRRKWEDAFPDQAEAMLGAPFSMVSNVIKGMREMAEGNVGAGLQAALPTALRGPWATFRMTQDGYTNQEGVRLPMQPGPAAYVAQALGYTPAERAEYGEAQQAQTSRRGVITREAANIRNNIAKAIERGDQEGAREWLQTARRFDQNNPAYAILPRLSTAFQQRQVARARADALDVPLGVSLRDVAARDRTAFANF
jgi:hypothetical protein